jgi:hypothetical protein
MFLFPVIYLVFFFLSVYYVLQGKADRFLLFVIFSLPIYITSLSVSFMYGFGSLIPVMQACKEFLVLLTLGCLIYRLNRQIRFHTIDWLIIAYLSYNLLYVLLPIGSYSFMEKLLSFKSGCFFVFVYFIGRLSTGASVNLNRYFSYTCLVSVAAAMVLLFELASGQHLQTHTGYADYNFYFFNVEPSGNYGLTWTFESGNGIRRFASFFSMPLEHAASTLITLSVLVALMTYKNNQLRPNRFILITLACTLFSVLFAFSRASFVSYFIMLYAYAILMKKKQWLKLFHWGLLSIIVMALIWMQGDLYEFISNTIDFTDSSSVSHLLEWVTGIQAIGSYPLGMGLGASGRIAGEFKENIGGENQLIIIGVQTGWAAIVLYIAVYVSIIRQSAQLFLHSHHNKCRKLGLAMVLLKVGLIIPLLTSEVESYVYISYFAWFLSGLVISIVMETAPLGNQDLWQKQLTSA